VLVAHLIQSLEGFSWRGLGGNDGVQEVEQVLFQ
jgi:hypothetical protein